MSVDIQVSTSHVHVHVCCSALPPSSNGMRVYWKPVDIPRAPCRCVLYTHGRRWIPHALAHAGLLDLPVYSAVIVRFYS